MSFFPNTWYRIFCLLCQQDEIAEDDDEDDDLGFLQGVNLSSLVREFEMEASNSGSQNLAILSLADDNEVEAPFSHLHDNAIHHSEDDLNIDFWLSNSEDDLNVDFWLFKTFSSKLRLKVFHFE